VAAGRCDAVDKGLLPLGYPLPLRQLSSETSQGRTLAPDEYDHIFGLVIPLNESLAVEYSEM
ncbi:hypothetical protein IL306_012905, partial [Fusarium sp. DS 682]